MSQGLTTSQVRHLLEQYGPNQLPAKRAASALKLIWYQINNALAALLVVAILISFLIGDLLDGWLILGILILNSALGFWQEYKASRELEALRSLEVDLSRVIRDGQQIQIPSWKIVPGDLVVLESGDKIPADGRAVESVSLSVNESSLTGESWPVAKSIHEGGNALFFGTAVVSGRGKLLVRATGESTKFGKLALTLAEVKEELTPLEVALSTLGKKVAVLALLVAAAVFLLKLLQGFETVEAFFTSVALLVAAVPEGLPAAVSVILAVGVRKMSQKKALVRKLSAVESLGAATVICTDKTGTLTENKMRVKRAEFKHADKGDFIKAAVVCNSAALVLKEGHGGYDILGDATEGALLLWVQDQGVSVELTRKRGRLVWEVPFDPLVKMMTVVWEEDHQKTTFAKGAPEVILPKCNLTEKELKTTLVRYEQMATLGLRVLALAKGDGNFKKGKLKFLGFLGVADSPRVEAKESLIRADQAGIRVVMLTGDNELTAKAIAEEVGLIRPGDEVLTGEELNNLTDEELVARLYQIRIFARIEPQQKLRIVRLYQKKGEVVAVTGDGVNDALALKQAHVGVAMGISGTDVAKEASDIVLLDDNFATLVEAVEQGRRIYSNILKVIKFLLTTNLSEILLIIMATLMGLPTPLLPVQILWINLVTDSLPAFALGVDSASPHLMRAPPRRNSPLLDGDMLRYIGVGGLMVAGLCLLSFYYLLGLSNLQFARGFVFSLIVVLQMMLAFVIRRHHHPLSNKYLLGTVAVVLLLQVLIVTVPALRLLFKIS